MKGRKLRRSVSPMGVGKGKRPVFNGPETFPDKPPEQKEMMDDLGARPKGRLDRPRRVKKADGGSVSEYLRKRAREKSDDAIVGGTAGVASPLVTGGALGSMMRGARARGLSMLAGVVGSGASALNAALDHKQSKDMESAADKFERNDLPGRPEERSRGGRLTSKERNALPGKDFALSGRRYPINDKNHARNALSRVSQNGSPEEKSKVRSAVHRKYPNIGKD